VDGGSSDDGGGVAAEVGHMWVVEYTEDGCKDRLSLARQGILTSKSL
jgi:hypothetical protein